MEVVFVDWAPIEHKGDIHFGSHIRRYYAWTLLNKIANEVLPFREKNGNINQEAVIKMFNKDSKIWVEYGCGGVAHFFVLLASFIQFKKTLILNVHDFTVEQQKDTHGEHPFLRRLRLQIAEQLLLRRANTIILPASGVLDYFKQGKNQKVLIMPPGVGGDELFIPFSHNNVKDKKIKTAIYFGSMRQKGIIPLIIELFSELNGWNLLLVGQKEGAKIEERENIKYLGVVSHVKLQTILDDSDVILIPYPKNDYLDKAMPIKLGYALKSCRAVIVTKLRGVSEYISMVGLEENVIYVEEWNLDSLKDALEKAQNLDIDAEKTIEKLGSLTWEPRFEKAVEIALDTSQATHGSLEWI